MNNQVTTEQLIKNIGNTVVNIRDPFQSSFARDFDALLLSIAKGTINTGAVKEFVMSEEIFNIGEKLDYFKAEVLASASAKNQHVDTSEYIKQGWKIAGDKAEYSKKLDDLFLAGCTSTNEKTHNAAIEGLEDLYEKNPEILLNTFQEVVENKDGNFPGNVRIAVIRHSTSIAIKSENEELYKIAARSAAIEMMNKDNKTSMAQFSFFQAEDLVKGIDTYSPFPSFGEIKENLPKPVTDKLAAFYNAILDNKDDFHWTVSVYAMERGIKLATENPEYREELNNRVVQYVVDGNDIHDGLHTVGSYLKSAAKNEVEKNRIELDYFKTVLNGGRISHDGYKSIVRYRLRAIGTENNGILRDEVISVLCKEAVKENNSYDWKRYAMESLSEGFSLSFKQGNLGEIFKQNAEEIGRREYAVIVEGIDQNNWKARESFHHLFHIVDEHIKEIAAGKAVETEKKKISGIVNLIL